MKTDTVERRPVLFLTYSYDDPDEASVLDVSGSLHQARRESSQNGWTGCPIYRLERHPDGTYGNGERVD